MGNNVYTVEEMNSLIWNLKKFWRGTHFIITPSSDDVIDKLEAVLFIKAVRDVSMEQYECYKNLFEQIDWNIQTPEVKKIMDDYIKSQKGA